MAPRLSPFTRTSAVTNPRQLAPTVGLSHDGFKFLKGSFEGLKGYAVGRMTKSRRGKLYIDDAGWGPEASSIEYGYRVPFGGIHVFIGKIGEPGPEPDTFMIQPRDSVNWWASTCAYKGMTRQRFRDNRQQLESQAKRIRSLVIETPTIPSQLDVGFYLHRRGRTSIKPLLSLARFNPFKLTRSDGSTTMSFHEDICRDKTTTVGAHRGAIA